MSGLVDKQLLHRVAIFILLAGFCILTFNFYNNMWKLTDQNWFVSWQTDSDALVIGRIMESRLHGMTSHCGSMGWTANPQEQKKAFYENRPYNSYIAYSGNAGFQGYCLGLLDKLTGLSPEQAMRYFYLFNASLIALFVMLATAWVGREVGICAAILSFSTLFYSEWMIVSAKSLYWMPWTMLLPCMGIASIFYLEEKLGKYKTYWLFLSAFIPMLIRNLCGYEFTSSIMITATLPLFYYGIKNKWPYQAFAMRFTIVSMALLVSFAVAVGIHMTLLTLGLGTFEQAFASLKARIAYRSGMGDISFITNPELIKSLQVPLWDVISVYFTCGNPIYSLGDFQIRMKDIFTFYCLILAGIFFFKKENWKNRQTIAIIVVSFLAWIAPLSWFILSKGHSYIHTPINYMLFSTCLTVWFIPILLCIIVREIGNRKRFYIYAALALSTFMTIKCYGGEYKQAKDIEFNIIAKKPILYTDKNISIYYSNNALYYIVSRNMDLKAPFFLHLQSDDRALLPEPRRQFGFDNYDFSFGEQELHVPFWKPYRVAKRNLPLDYPISHIQTGQYDKNGLKWDIKISLSEECVARLPEYIVPSELSDQNWTKGIHVNNKIILLPGARQEYYLLKGKKMLLADGTTAVIKDIEMKDKTWCHLILDRTISVENGYPVKLKLIN